MVPVVLVAIAPYAAFAAVGLGGTLVALVLAHATLGAPYVVLSVEAAARVLDPPGSSARCGDSEATAWQTLRRVTLPLVHGLLAGMLFAAIVFVGGPSATTLPRKMWSTITQDEFDPLPTAVATLQMVVALGGSRSTGRAQRSVSSHPSPEPHAWRARVALRGCRC